MKRRRVLLLTIAFVLAAGLTVACENTDEAAKAGDISKETAVKESGINTESADSEGKPEETEEGTDSDEAGSEAELTGFTVYDKSQNVKKLSEYVTGNKVTMINFWATFCGPCIREMPELAEIAKEYKDKGFEIVGVTTDATDYENGGLIPNILKDADDILKQTGVEYPICFAGADLIRYTQITAVPTTFFVDEKGNLLTDPMVGSRSGEEWESIITRLLYEADRDR